MKEKYFPEVGSNGDVEITVQTFNHFYRHTHTNKATERLGASRRLGPNNKAI